MEIRTHTEAKELGASLRFIKVGGTSFETPCRALSLTLGGPSEATARLHPDARGLVELYKEFDANALREFCKNPQNRQNFEEETLRKISTLPDLKETILFIVTILERGFYPSQPQVGCLAELLSTSLIDMPCVPTVVPRDADSFLSYAKTFIDTFTQHDDSTLLGYVPNFANRDVVRTVRFYLGEGIKDFVMDFNGHHAGALRSSVQTVRALIDQNVGRNFFLHALNIGPGAFQRSQEVSPARDFLALVSGVDSIGSKHIRRKMPLEVWERLAEDPLRGRRMFARDDYGYYDPRAFSRRFRDATDEGLISPRVVCRKPLSSIVRLFNAEKQALEAAAVRKRLSKGSLLKYIRSKTQLSGDVQSIIEQQTLAAFEVPEVRST